MSLNLIDYGGTLLTHNGFYVGQGNYPSYWKDKAVFERTNTSGSGTVYINSDQGSSALPLSGTATSVSADLSGLTNVSVRYEYVTTDGIRTNVVQHPASSLFTGAGVAGTASAYYTGNGKFDHPFSATNHWYFGSGNDNKITGAESGVRCVVEPVVGGWFISGKETRTIQATAPLKCGFNSDPQHCDMCSASWNIPTADVLAALKVSTGSDAVFSYNSTGYVSPVYETSHDTYKYPNTTRKGWMSAGVTGSGYRENFGLNDTKDWKASEYATPVDVWCDTWCYLGTVNTPGFADSFIANSSFQGNTFALQGANEFSASSSGMNIAASPIACVVAGSVLEPTSQWAGGGTPFSAQPPGNSVLHGDGLVYWKRYYTNSASAKHWITSGHHTWAMSGTMY